MGLKDLSRYSNLFDRLPPVKIVNAAKVLGSYHWSKISGNPRMAGLPFSISIEPTTSCNLRCPECPSGLRSFTRPTGMIDMQLYEKIIAEVKSHVVHMLLYFQGEPYLHKGFFDLVNTAGKARIFTATSTNAHYLSDDLARQTVESGLDKLIISIDGTTQETYEQYRIGGSLEKVISGTENIIHWKRKLKSKTPYVVFQYLVVKPNEHQVNDVEQLANSLGVDEVLFKTAQIYDFENGSDLIPSIDKYSRYQQKDDGSFKLKNELLNQCWKMWHSCVITWDGKVVPCCFDKDASHPMGDLKVQSFKEIWFGEKYQAFRQAILRSRSEIDICKNCSEGTKVWA
ncbi:MAG: SPASM domain-containing protein [Bacteroidetes bacterium]|nr:SPASM domain-containing protein [Bacteroidota bacterium]MDA1121459.1 SPASM domain-containing protein [Bacteroidota bacterium]